MCAWLREHEHVSQCNIGVHDCATVRLSQCVYKYACWRHVCVSKKGTVTPDISSRTSVHVGIGKWKLCRLMMQKWNCKGGEHSRCL